MEYVDYYASGRVVEVVENGSDRCESWLLLPAENLWPQAVRGFLYILAMIYFFMGIAISSDVFMCSIEVITSKKRTIVRWDEERQVKIEREILIWNETVANLTLMALGSSAPEIMLATVEAAFNLGKTTDGDSLGTFTIIGSAAFNLLIITAICIVSVPTPQIKAVKEVGVFVLTSIWSIWAYVWMLLVVGYITPGFIDPWEAWLTLGFFPMFVLMAYCQDSGWWCKKKKIQGIESGEGEDDDDSNVRVVMTNQTPGLAFHMPKELHVLEAQKAHRMSIVSINSVSKGSDNKEDDGHTTGQDRMIVRKSLREPQAFARARFRHAAVSAMMGGRKMRPIPATKYPKLADVVTKVKTLNDAVKQGKSPDGELAGKFTFASDRYAVLESAGNLEIDVLFHRQIPPRGMVDTTSQEKVVFRNGSATSQGVPSPKDQESSIHIGVVSVEYETREGSAKPGKDFTFSRGTLVFKENEYKKSFVVPIVNDNQYEADVDFYVILKNAKGQSGLGDPSVTRVTIVDDDEEPGEFLFEEAHYHADMTEGTVTVKIVREHGFDGKVTLEYSTIDGTATGGKVLGPGVDYVTTNGSVQFDHSETSKTISVNVNKESKSAVNFILALRNPSLGARIGVRSAVVCHVNKEDELMDRIADVMADEDEMPQTWGGQFRNAMTVGGSTDDDGNEIPPGWLDYMMHFFTFFWKLLAACIPPTSKLGAWPAFVLSLGYIFILTLVVEQLGNLLGCVIKLENSVTGITIIALGTSLPDTFASRTAAKQDEHADAAIGNITGSNSVNVFLGLGLPWVLSTMYALAHGTRYTVRSGNLTQSVIIFGVVGTMCVIMLLLRRKFIGGELGGKNGCVKWLTSLFLVLLWIIYILLSSLKAYDIIDL